MKNELVKPGMFMIRMPEQREAAHDVERQDPFGDGQRVDAVVHAPSLCFLRSLLRSATLRKTSARCKLFSAAALSTTMGLVRG